MLAFKLKLKKNENYNAIPIRLHDKILLKNNSIRNQLIAHQGSSSSSQQSRVFSHRKHLAVSDPLLPQK